MTITLNDHISNFETLLHKSNDISSRHRNIQMLVIKLYKIKNELSSPVMDLMLIGEMLLTISEF